jgi:hypothetical protein
MTITYKPLYRVGRLSPADFQVIETHLRRGEEMVRIFPEFRDLQNVTVRVIGSFCIPEFPVHGFARLDGRKLNITVDRERPVYMTSADQILHTTIAHELHHLVRIRGAGTGLNPVGYGDTLGKALVTEGLAQAFEIQATGLTNRYSIALSDAEILMHEDRIKGMIDKKDYDHHAIFQSLGKGEWPEWFGYSFGYSIAKAGLEHLGLTAAEAVHVSAEHFLRPYLDGKFSILRTAAQNNAASALKTLQL